VSDTQDSGNNWFQTWQQETAMEFGAPPPGNRNQQQSIPPMRRVSGASPGGGGGQYWYGGTNLVGVGDVVTDQGQYNIRLDARGLYASLTAAERAARFDILKRKGFYGSSKPGTYENDIAAIESWLDYSNTMYMTADRSLTEMQRTMMDREEGGYAPRYRVSSAADLGVVFKEVAKNTIGRAFTEDEANRAVQAYQQLQIQTQQAMMRGGVVEEAPSADVFAQQFAQQAAPTEADAYKFLGVMNRIFNATSGAM
jgi:hypothetical protein